MGVPTSEVGYSPAMPRREDKDMWWHWIKKKTFRTSQFIKPRAEIYTRNIVLYKKKK